MPHRWTWVAVGIGCFAVACGGDDGSGTSPDLAKDAGPDPVDSGPVVVDLGPIDSSLQVQTRDGVLRGTLRGTTREFRGIPYAKPPVGDLRWRSPEAGEPWKGERDASAFGSGCPQAGSGNENCLFLNVQAPEISDLEDDALRPTMVWLHGGAFTMGRGDIYNGVQFVERGNVVFVTLNYRLGALGFLAHPALTDDAGGRGSSGNYGIEDQALALKWIGENIEAFGGDPDNVTLFGESAGSACTCVQLGTPGAKGRVHRAIMESGACLGFSTSLAQAEEMGEASVKDIGCDFLSLDEALTCLKEKSAEEIVNATSDIIEALVRQRWRPIVDGVVVPLEEDIDPIRVPIIIGTNRDEGGDFGILAGSQSNFEAMVMRNYPEPEDHMRVLEAYSVENYGSTSEAFSAMVADGLFVCPTRRLVRAVAAQGERAYLYQFVYGPARHAHEIPYVFGQVSQSDENAKAVSDAMLGSWLRFAQTGDPNDAERLQWPVYDQASDQHMIFDVELSIGTGLQKDQCDLLDTLPPVQL